MRVFVDRDVDEGLWLARNVARAPAGSPLAGAVDAEVERLTAWLQPTEAIARLVASTAARLDGVGPVSQATAELVCCDAEVTEVTVARNGAVLDAGRTRKQPTRAQRIAVIARDQTCVGCGAPAARCQVHRPRQPPPPTHP